MMPLRKSLLLLSLLAACGPSAGAEEAAVEKTVESVSPDGRFAFLYTVGPDQKTFDLIEKKSGKVLSRVAESDPDLGNRFSAEVLWRPDSKGFALTVMIVRLGTYVDVFLRDGATFPKVKLPELVADIPKKLTHGKDLGHIAALNSQSALRWEKDNSLVIEIVNMVDGGSGSVTATRDVTLGFGRVGKAVIQKSTIKFTSGKD